MSIAFILLAVAVIIAGGFMGKPPGWVVLGLAVLALLMHVLGVPVVAFR